MNNNDENPVNEMQYKTNMDDKENKNTGSEHSNDETGKERPNNDTHDNDNGRKTNTANESYVHTDDSLKTKAGLHASNSKMKNAISRIITISHNDNNDVIIKSSLLNAMMADKKKTMRTLLLIIILLMTFNAGNLYFTIPTCGNGHNGCVMNYEKASDKYYDVKLSCEHVYYSLRIYEKCDNEYVSSSAYHNNEDFIKNRDDYYELKTEINNSHESGIDYGNSHNKVGDGDKEIN